VRENDSPYAERFATSASQFANMILRKQDFLRMIERLAVGVAITRADGTLEHANRYLYEVLEVRGGASVGLPFDCFEGGTASGGLDGRPSGVLEPGYRAMHVRNSRGMTLDVLHAVYPLYDEAGVATHFAHVLQYLGDERRVETLSRLAFYDSLTGLPNRNLFDDRLDRALAVGQRNRGAFALLCIDIDHFKQVNDAFGHEAGDELLREVAARLARSVRASDTVARWGGDEFVAILDGVADQELAARIASKLLDACGSSYTIGGRDCRITLSIGASLYPRDGHDAATLFERADRAMYEVKARGRNGYHALEQPLCSYVKTA
jgi:diguanylate cyclase (GGDEF)-like protein